MNRRLLHQELIKRIIATMIMDFIFIALGLHPLTAFASGYFAVALYQWIGLGAVITEPERQWTRFTMSALWPFAYLYAAGDDD